MSTPVLQLLAGPNGSGKSTFARRVLQPVTGLPFINADEIAAARWPGDEERHAYEASVAAAELRARALEQRASFLTETVFSHVSKLDLVADAVGRGYLVELYVMLLPEDVTVARVAYRVAGGGHTVPEQKIRDRYRRLWPLVAQACRIAHSTRFYDNSRSAAFAPVAVYALGLPVGTPAWPIWTPAPLTAMDQLH